MTKKVFGLAGQNTQLGIIHKFRRAIRGLGLALEFRYGTDGKKKGKGHIVTKMGLANLLTGPKG